MDQHQWECMNCGGDVDAHLTSCPHCAEISAAADTTPLPADDDLMVAPLGARRTLGEDGQRRLAVGLVSGFAVLLTGIGMLIARDSTSSVDRQGRTDETLIELTSTSIASSATSVSGRVPVGVSGQTTVPGADAAGSTPTTSVASGGVVVLGVTVAPSVTSSRVVTTTRATVATTEVPATNGADDASTTVAPTTTSVASTVASTTTTVASTTTVPVATTTTVAELAGLPVTFCPGDASESNVSIKTAESGDGALCSRVFWQFERPGQFVAWGPLATPAPPVTTAQPDASDPPGTSAQQATLRVRYANGYGVAARTTVDDGTATRTVTWPSTGSWQTWATVSIPITVGPDAVIRIEWSGANGYTGDDATSTSLNIDQVRIVAG